MLYLMVKNFDWEKNVQGLQALFSSASSFRFYQTIKSLITSNVWNLQYLLDFRQIFE